ncbi:hypothetical protein L6R49_24420 [Myxococcota bacterium]|nr:hypothetical protein [Myxococcota bacterium]
MVSTTLWLLLVSCAARDATLRPLAELAPAPARAMPFQTEEEAWRALLTQGGLPPSRVPPTLSLDDRVPAPGRFQSALVAPRFLGSAEDARALMSRWTMSWAGRPVALHGLSDETLVDGVAAWALVGLAREVAGYTASEGWTLRQDELYAEAVMATDAGIIALDALIAAGRAPERWRAAYLTLLTAVLDETRAPGDEAPAEATLNVGEELRLGVAVAPLMGLGVVSLTEEEQTALRLTTRALLEHERGRLAGPTPPTPDSLGPRLDRYAEATVERSLAAIDPPLQSWSQGEEGVYLGVLDARGWGLRVDLEQERVRVVLTVPLAAPLPSERDLMALANAVNGTLDSAHLDLMPGELRLRHAWTPLTSDSTAADALDALVTIAERWAPLFEQVGAKALSVEEAWSQGQGETP